MQNGQTNKQTNKQHWHTETLHTCLPKILKTPGVNKRIYRRIGENQHEVCVTSPVNELTAADVTQVSDVDTDTRGQITAKEES